MENAVYSFHNWNMKIFDDYDGLALFVRTVQAGGFAAAERAVGIPKATLSRRLSVLEESLGVRLARRTRKGVVLTEEGQRLFEQSRVALQIAEEAVSQVQDDKASLSGRVRVSLPPDISTALLAPALIRFKQRHPDVVIEMTLADRRVSLVEEGYDLVVRMGAIPDSGLLFRKFSSLPRQLVASPQFLADQPALANPNDLKSLPALAIRREQIEWDLVHADGTKTQLFPRIDFAANRQSILVDAAVAGLGVANLPCFMIKQQLVAGTLLRVLPQWTPSPVEMTALWQKDRITGRVIKAIVAELAETLTAPDTL
jgi:DNA-binding transcriptional LysR family regulator